MTDLSPAAQAVLGAFTGDDTIYGLHLMTPRLAAALRAAADQVVPADKPSSFSFGAPQTFAIQRRTTRRQLLAIAAELENQ